MITLTFEDLEAEIKKQSSDLTFNGNTELDMTELPDGIQSITVNNDSFDGTKLTTLPDGITIKANWNIYLDKLTAMSSNVTIEAGLGVWLYELTTMGNNVNIKSNEYICLSNTDIGIREIILTDDCSVPTKVIQFLQDNGITVRCSEASQLVNLAFEGVKVEIVK